MSQHEHALERRITIRARPATVFRYFTDSTRFAAWWGQGSTIEPRPGGRVEIVYPNGVRVHGEVLEIEPERRIAFSYGYESGQPIAPGASLVTIELLPHAEGTELRLRHAFATPEPRDLHVPGWRYQLAVFSNVVTREAHTDLDGLLDRWHSLWTTPSGAARRAELERLVTAEVGYRDLHGATAGLDDLEAHIDAVQRFFPGVALRRAGAVRHCQGTALVEWELVAADGTRRGSGSSVVELAPDGRIRGVVGLWRPA